MTPPGPSKKKYNTEEPQQSILGLNHDSIGRKICLVYMLAANIFPHPTSEGIHSSVKRNSDSTQREEYELTMCIQGM